MASLVHYSSFHDAHFDTTKCAEAAHAIRTKGALKFLCGVDGSAFSDTALQCAKSLLKKNDRLNVFHAFSSEDDLELPPHLRSSCLKELYESKLSGMDKYKYSLLWEERYSDESKTILPVKTVLIKATDGRIPRCTSDFLVVGFTGNRKHDDFHSPNHDGHGMSYEGNVGGSNADFTMRFIHIPTILAKKEVGPGGKTFVMAVNNSDLSRVGLDVVYTLLTPKDELVVLHVCGDDVDEVDDIKQYYEEDIQLYCPTTKCKFVSLVKSGNDTIASHIQAYVEENGVDFLCIAPRARTDGSFASLTEQVVRLVHTNIIMCKL